MRKRLGQMRAEREVREEGERAGKEEEEEEEEEEAGAEPVHTTGYDTSSGERRR